jgi:hypothetical protein
MKNCKQLIIGILIGAVGTMSITALAEYIVNPNSFPVTVNGSPVELEGYNINDRTYFQLRDIGDKVGFGVNFQNDTIHITTVSVPTPTPIPTSTPTAAPTSTPRPFPPAARPTANPKAPYGPGVVNNPDNEYSSDGLLIEVVDGKKYVITLDIATVYDFDQHGYVFASGYIRDSNFNHIIEGIVTHPDNSGYVDISYYESTLQPFLQSQCK